MKLLSRNAGKKTRGQTMVEFALVLPVLLLTMYGVMEFGRLLFIYVTTTSASREAARYASGVELVDRGGVLVERFRDCEGIRDAAIRVGLLAGLENGDIEIRYDLGPADTRTWNQLPQCPDSVSLGNRVRVAVTGHFHPIVPLVPWSEEVLLRLANIRSETARTIIRNVEVGPNFQPPPQEEAGSPPFVRFEVYSRWVNEHDYNRYEISPGVLSDPYTVAVIAYNEDGTSYTGGLEITFSLFGEADGSDFELVTSSPLSIPAGEGSADIELYIQNDTLYEYLERIIIVIDEEQIGASRRQPWVHVVYIQDNDSPPPVNFLEESSILYEERDPEAGAHEIIVELGETAQAASVGFMIDATATTAQRDIDYEISPDPDIERLIFPLTGINFNIVDRRAVISVTPLLDALPEGTEEIVLILVNPFNAYLGPNDTHTIYLHDGEDP